MSERSWQDIMIERFGDDWVKFSYSVKEIGELAEQLVVEQERVKKLKVALFDLARECHSANQDSLNDLYFDSLDKAELALKEIEV